MKKAAIILIVFGVLLAAWGGWGLLAVEVRFVEGSSAGLPTMALKRIEKPLIEMIFDRELYNHQATRPVYRSILGIGVGFVLVGITLGAKVLQKKSPGQ